MNCIQDLAKENFIQSSQLLTEIGEEGSGYARYSAAMYFHKRGRISLELLEIYRRCCKLDNEDPLELAKHEGVKLFNKNDLVCSEDSI